MIWYILFIQTGVFMSKLSKKQKKLQKEINSRNGIYTELDNRAYFLYKQLGEGLTLQEVADMRDQPYSELVAEIQEHPKLVQAMKDGKAKGHAYWTKKLKTYILEKHANATALKLFYGNYMGWWTSPIPEEFDENTIVNVSVYRRKPTKKEKAGMKKAKEMAQ
jgi:hypothetical protein